RDPRAAGDPDVSLGRRLPSLRSAPRLVVGGSAWGRSARAPGISPRRPQPRTLQDALGLRRRRCDSCDILLQNGTLPVIAGKPPADVAQPSGMNGMMVTVPTNAAQDPSAPRIPNRLFQNPRNNSRANDHSDAPSTQLAPRMPNT